MVRYRHCTRCKKIKRIVSSFEIPCIHKSFELCEECNKKVMENLRKTVKKMTKEEQCPCDDCDATCDYWDSKYCCTYCRWQYGDIEPDCENCDPMDI